MADEQWDRREAHKKLHDEIDKRLNTLEENLDEKLEKIGDEVERCKEAIIGGLDGEEGLKTKVSRYEKDYNELRAIVSSLGKAVHGDVLGRGSLSELAKGSLGVANEAKAIAEEAKRTAAGRLDIQTSRRGQNFAFIVGVLSFTGILTVGLVANWDKIRGKKETPAEWAARITTDIERMKQSRGPEVEEKLKVIERAARTRRKK